MRMPVGLKMQPRVAAFEERLISNSEYNHTAEKWTGVLAFSIIAVVLSTSFMNGYNFRITSANLEFSLLPPPNPKDSNMTFLDVLDTCSDLYTDNIVNCHQMNTFNRFCIFTLLIFKLIGTFWFPAAIGDKFGRVRTLIFCSICGFLSCGISLLTQKATLLCNNLTSADCIVPTFFGQALHGFQTGIGSVVAPALIIELAPGRLRGACGSFYELFFVFGSILSLFIDRFFPKNQQAIIEYHLLFSFSLYVIQSIALLFAIESPRWLSWKGRSSDAMEAIERLRSVDKLQLEPEFNDLKNTNVIMVRSRFVKLVGVGVLLNVVYLLTGRDVVDIFGTLGLRISSSASVVTLCYVTISVLAMVAGIALVDRCGRRLLVLTGLMGMIISLVSFAVLAAVVGNAGSTANKNKVYMAGIGAICYVTSFGIGPGPISLFMVGEMFPQKKRLMAISYSQSIAFFLYLAWRCAIEFSGMTFILPVYYPYLLASLFAGICGFAWVLLYFYLPETNGASLESVVQRIAKTTCDVEHNRQRTNNNGDVVEEQHQLIEHLVNLSSSSSTNGI